MTKNELLLFISKAIEEKCFIDELTVKLTSADTKTDVSEPSECLSACTKVVGS